ncbi:MAG: hypothetical protein R3A51_07955 [Nannocystaceae bacterium]
MEQESHSPQAPAPAPRGRPAVIVGHESAAVGKAVAILLQPHGFDVQVVTSGDVLLRMLSQRRWDGVVVDAAIPGPPIYELNEAAKSSEGGRAPVPALILIATVHRRQSYRRRPVRLYGADDHVDVHRLGAELPAKLWGLLGREEPPPSHHDAALQTVLGGDETPEDFPAGAGAALAELLMASLVLSHADELVMAMNEEQARDMVATSLAAAHARFLKIVTQRASADPAQSQAAGAAVEPDEAQQRPATAEPIERAFTRVLVRFGLAEVGR